MTFVLAPSVNSISDSNNGIQQKMKSAVSPLTQQSFESIEKMKNDLTRSSQLYGYDNTRSTDAAEGLAESLYQSLSVAKIVTSSFAAHLSGALRDRLFRQLDSLHDIDSWETGDTPVSAESYRTFMRTLLWLKPGKWPSLGLSSEGHLLATWGTTKNRITLEFLSRDDVRWALSLPIEDGQTVRNAGHGPAVMIRHLLSPYEPAHWFDAE